MALTAAKVREIMSAAGVTAEAMEKAVNAIMDGHITSINALREERDGFKTDAEKLPGVQRELDELKAKGDPDWKQKFEDEHTAFEKYREQVQADKEKAQKIELYRSLLKDYSGFIMKDKPKGADVDNPPANGGGSSQEPSRAAQLAAEYHKNLYGETKGE